MRHLGVMAAAAAILTLTAGPVRAQGTPQASDAPTTISLTVRVTPANAWKVVGDLHQMMNDGPSAQAGTTLLRDLAGVLSAAVAIETIPPPTSGLRISSEPLQRALQQGGPKAAREAFTKEQQRLSPQTSASSFGQTAAAAAKALEAQAAKAREAVGAWLASAPTKSR